MPSFQRLVIIAALGSTAVLTACAPDTHVLPTISASPTGLVPTSEGSFDPETDPVNPSVGVDCRTLVDDQTLYEWGSGNFALDVNYEPAAGTTASELVALGGIACRWVNLTSAETVDIAVAIPTADQLAAAQSAAASRGEAAPEISDAAYFRVEGSVGYAEVFTDQHWIAAESPWFGSQFDAQPLLSAAMTALD